MDARRLSWQIDRSTKVHLEAGERVQPSRTSLWLMVRAGAVELDGEHVLRAGCAVYLHHALIRTLVVTQTADLLLADLRHVERDFTPDVILVPGFADKQAGVVALLSVCPVTGPMRVERPTVTSAYGELLGLAMLTEHEHQQPTAGTHIDPVVRAASRSMAADPLRAWTLAQLADSAHVSTTTLVDRFRAATDLTPMRMLRRLRLRNAMDELTSTDAGVATIAHRAGYGSAEAFVRAFRAETGCTPGRWRQSSRCTTLIDANDTAANAAATAPTVIVAQTVA